MKELKMNNTVRQKITDNNVVLDKSLLNQAGIHEEFDLVVQNGAIFILPVVKEEDWEILETFSKSAKEGKLEDPSENHDSYLYGEKK